MTNQDTSPTTDTDALTTSVRSTGGPAAPATELTADDQPYIDRILAIDPLNDLPSIAELPHGFNLPAMKVTGLSPAMRKEAEAELSKLSPDQRDAREGDICAAIVRAHLPTLRLKTGLGAGATAYHREQLLIARDYTDLAGQIDRYRDALDEISRHDTSIDERGEAVAIPVYAIQGVRRAAYEANIVDLTRQGRLLFQEDGTPGLEAEKRLKAAMVESVSMQRELDRQVSENADAKAMAEQMGRDARVKAKAESLARLAGVNGPK